MLAGSISYWLLPGAPGRATWCVRRGEQSIRSSDKKNKQARALISRRQQEGRRDEQAPPPLLAAARCTRDCVSRTPQPGRAELPTSGRHRDSEEGREAKGGGRKSKQGGRVLYREGRKGSGDRCTQQPHTGEKGAAALLHCRWITCRLPAWNDCGAGQRVRPLPPPPPPPPHAAAHQSAGPQAARRC